MKRFSFLGMLLLLVPCQAQEVPNDSQYAIFMGDNGVIVLRFEIQIGGKGPKGVFEQYVDELMKSLDKNGDGVVTVEESRGKFLTARDAQQAQLIPQIDNANLDLLPDTSPADGKITRKEFLAYYKRIGLQPFQLNYRANGTTQTPNRPATRQAANSAEIPLFARLDINSDGRLSVGELKGALQTLRKLDLDDDGTISIAELSPIASNQFLAQPQQQSPARAASNSPFLGQGSDEPIVKQIRRLIEKYDTADPLKSEVPAANGRNQTLSARELGITPEALARHDVDGNGQLEFDELRQFIVSPEATIVMVINLDVAEALNAKSDRVDIQEKLLLTPDGAANVNLGTTQLSIVRGATFDVGSAETLLKPQFMVSDSDANGYLEKSEAERAFLFGATFENLDADKNGKVFFEEIIAYFQVRFDAARSRTVLSINEQGRTLFEILDTDRDRRLSFRELQAAADKMALWDKDGDGLLAESEIPLQYRLIIARGNLPALGGDVQALEGGMNATGTPPERTSGPAWFRKMDKNRDGEVSQREFLGELAAFEELDRNHDGFIDLAEALSVAPAVDARKQ